MKERKNRRIAIAVAAVLWGATFTAMLIHVDIRVYLTSWLATLIASLVAAALWMIRPDHGVLSHVRLRIATLRHDAAIAEEQARLEELARTRLERVA
ncbi:hypothetical protein ACIBKY_53490 [Nonomuraea sp. NPDC050394]|uniref:hypothetical protein n=1 Tax=Nonomuraea sp. NPDC050394 TaxID=3364363 RepID=UPI00379BEE6D